MQDKVSRMKELIKILNEAGKAYYQEDREIMPNVEYDKLYDELQNLEEETGISLAGTPTKSVGYEALNELPKEAHEQPMLSLDKTKNIETLGKFLGDKKGLLSWKLDGLTIVLTYRGGTLIKAVTRGNGEIGEVITNNARVFQNIPLTIAYKGELIIRGEAVITYSDFQKINQEIANIDSKYKNPRNLCSGSVRQLNNEITARRKVNFFAFALVQAADVDFLNSRKNQLEWLRNQGFDIVEYQEVVLANLEEQVLGFEARITDYDLPSDGLVLIYDDIAYGNSLGSTAKFPRDSFAFKWADEMKETHLVDIEWSPSRTGLINPVAIFEPVELEGTTVTRASVHNVSILKELELGIGDVITVYKANMIIPQIAENLTRSSNLELPKQCPVCHGETIIKKQNDVESLYCPNEECLVKKIKSFTLLVSRNGLNIEGLSEATLEKFIVKGYIKEYADIFHISNYKDEIVVMEGFGEKSYENLINSIEKARDTNLPKVIYSLGISNIGLANAKMICKHFHYDIEAMESADIEELSQIDGVGEIIARSFVTYFANENKAEQFRHLLLELHLEDMKVKTSDLIFEGINFVITGSVEHFKNRNEVKDII
ncbi:MAG TPA: NAD-dependent DNA ligase LigA, partial [Candidatus Merdenecus merdavium]|nr:NAD-dependent DNA ligase LigA [Candidatus Merdenecus merdavium]